MKKHGNWGHGGIDNLFNMAKNANNDPRAKQILKDHFASVEIPERLEALRAFRTLVSLLEEVEEERHARLEAGISELTNKYAK